MKVQFAIVVTILATTEVSAPFASKNARSALAKQDLQTAKNAADWILSTSIRADGGIVWPADPNDRKSVNTTLYAGTPGPILFFLESYRYTNSSQDLAAARKGADALLVSMNRDNFTGFYEGRAGIGFTLGEAYLFTHDKKYLDGATQCVEWLKNQAMPVGQGVEWANGNDIIGGASGTGLSLLWADKELRIPGARELAIKAGKRLVEVGESKGPGKTAWRMSANDSYPEMPNFSHGTAGIAYFLTTLYLDTGNKEFLDAGLAGAKYLLSIADMEHESCLIYHDAKRQNLFYLSWCHGPAGDARLFYQIYRATEDPQWIEWIRRCAKAMIVNGAPDVVVTPGKWNNISACCGVTGQSEFFLDMYLLTKETQYLNLAREGTRRLVSEATNDEKGARWIQAETRVKPDLLLAQTGYMQGASGVGMWLLHMGAFSEGERKPTLTFPDNPFQY